MNPDQYQYAAELLRGLRGISKDPLLSWLLAMAEEHCINEARMAPATRKEVANGHD